MEEAAAVALPLEEDMGRDTRIEQLLSEWNLPFELDPAYPLNRLKIEDATQIRLKQHRAPSATVDQYVVHMKHGAIFPPIVVGTNAMLIDGNARVEACNKTNRKTFPAYKVKFPHLGMAKMIGAALNQMGGDRLTEDEIVVAAEAMIGAGHADEAIAKTLGRSVSHIRNVRKDREFEETVERLGLTALEVPKAVARTLAGIQHDEPFKAALEAVAALKPTPKAVSGLVKAIDETRSDADALAAVYAAKENWGPLPGPPPQRRSQTRSQGKKALGLVQQLVTLGQDAPEALVVDDNEARTAWLALNALVIRVLALYPPQESR